MITLGMFLAGFVLREGKTRNANNALSVMHLISKQFSKKVMISSAKVSFLLASKDYSTGVHD